MYELKKVSLSSASRVGGFLSAVLYLVFVIIALATGQMNLPGSSGAVTVLVGVVVAGASGVVFGVIIAALYNLVANTWGGLHLDFHLLMEHEEPTIRREPEAVHQDNHPA